MGPALLQSDFQVPADVSEYSRKRPVQVDPTEEQQEGPGPSKRLTRASAKSSSSKGKGKGKGKGKSQEDIPTVAVVPSGPPKKYICTQCGHSTDRKNDFENHMNQHNGHKLKCTHCPKVFYSEASRKTHVQNNHLNVKRARCSFTECQWEDKDFGKLKVHLFDAHGVGEEARCKICQRKLDNWRSYVRHQTTCGRQKDKRCPICPKTYKDLEKLTEHMKEQHTGKGYSPCICDKCGKVFKNKDSLRAHQNTSCN